MAVNKRKIEEKVAEVLNILKSTEPAEYHRILNKAARKRPWRPKRSGWANVLDQLLHALYGGVLLLPVLLLDSYWGAALFGFLAGSIREIEQFFNQDLKIKMIYDRLLDIFFFVLGALAIFHFFH